MRRGVAMSVQRKPPSLPMYSDRKRRELNSCEIVEHCLPTLLQVFRMYLYNSLSSGSKSSRTVEHNLTVGREGSPKIYSVFERELKGNGGQIPSL